MDDAGLYAFLRGPGDRLDCPEVDVQGLEEAVDAMLDGEVPARLVRLSKTVETQPQPEQKSH